MSTVEMHHATKAARDWAQTLAPYRRASAARGLFELAVTVLPFVALWAAMLIAARDGRVWISFAMAPLAALPCDPSCDIWQSRPARHRRHRYADGLRIFRTQLARPDRLPALSPSPGDVRDRPGISVPDREPLAFRLHAQGRHAMGQHDDDQLGHPAGGGPPHLERGHRAISCGRSSDHRVRRDRRRLAVLRAASVRADHVARSGGLEPARGGIARQFVLPPAGAAALVLRQYRRPSVHHLASGIPFYRLPEVLRDHPALGDVG